MRKKQAQMSEVASLENVSCFEECNLKKEVVIEACGGSKSCASPRDTRKKRIGNVCARFENRNQDRDVYRFTLHCSCTLHCTVAVPYIVAAVLTGPS